MTTMTRPFHDGSVITNWRTLWQAMNKTWWLQRLPMFLLAVPASYGVGAFADQRYPMTVSVIAGAGFEAAYMGAVAFADHQLDDDAISKWLWWGLNIGAVLSSALINVLFSAGGSFGAITWEDGVHGAPMAILNFLYALLLHHNSTKAMVAERRRLVEEERKIEEAQRRADEERYKCPHCPRGFATINRLNGHRRHCKG